MEYITKQKAWSLKGWNFYVSTSAYLIKICIDSYLWISGILYSALQVVAASTAFPQYNFKYKIWTFAALIMLGN